MTGIVSYGAYVPTCRLPLSVIAGRAAREGGPERSVVAFDEDSVTMAVAAARDCLAGFDPAQVDAVFFASTTSPYHEKQAASIVARAVGLRRDVRAVDIAGSLRAGTSAIVSAVDAVKAGTARTALVVSADCRLAAPRSPLERNLGDAAAAVLVGSDGVIAELEHAHAVADEILDVWRAEGDRFVSTWEDRFVVEQGYLACLGEAVAGLLESSGAGAGEFARVALYAPDARSHGRVARQLGFEAGQLQDPMFGRVGSCGAAFAPLLLVAALQDAAAGDRLLVASYGDGAEALALKVTAQVAKLAPRDAVAGSLNDRRALGSYDAYLAARNLAPGQHDRRDGAGIAATVHHRDRDADIGFTGARCRGCGTVHFPAQRVCYQCHARDDFEPVRLADGSGRVMSYTFDYFFPTPEPPLVAAMIEADEGSRVYLQMTDVVPDEMRCDLPVEFVFRKIHEVGGKPNYFWKARPRASERPSYRAQTKPQTRK